MSSCCASARQALTTPVQSGHLPVVVVGAGPVGLAAAVRLLERGLEPVVLEAGASVGTALRAWGHVRMFSPWRYNIDHAARAALAADGWNSPDAEAFPTGRELAENYLEPLAGLPRMASRLHLNARVTAIARAGFGKLRTAGRDAAPFEVRYTAAGGEASLLARAVIDASGTWSRPGWAGASGLPALGERQSSDLIHYGMPNVLGTDRDRYAGRRTIVVGSGDSALGTLIELATVAARAPGTSIVWAARNADLTRAFGGGAADRLPARGALGMHVRRLVDAGTITLLRPFAIDRIDRAGALLVVAGVGAAGKASVDVDRMIVVTGFRPDLDLLREVRLDLDPALECPNALAPLIDPNLHSCGTVRPHGAAELEQPERNLFIVGMKSYGRAPTFLLATGHEQVRSVAAYLAGDLEAAQRVELDLPETGVCSAGPIFAADADCCGPTADGPAPCCAPAALAVPADAAA